VAGLMNSCTAISEFEAPWPASRAIAHQANDQGTTLREAALASSYINGKDFDRIVDPAAMTSVRQHSDAESVPHHSSAEQRCEPVRDSATAVCCVAA
jgi:hypothetical protein